MEDGNLDANRAVKGQQFLEKCGLLGTYEYLLKNLVENGLPTGNIYEYAALIVLRYEKKLRTQVRKVIGKTSPSVDNLSFDHEARTEPTEFSSPVPGPTSKIMMKEEDKAVNIKKKPEESKVKQLEEKKLRPEENKVKQVEEKKSKPEENKVKQLEESKIKQLEEKKSKPEESKVKQLEEKKSKPEENKVKQLEENKTKPEDLKEEDKKASKKPTKATEEKKQLKASEEKTDVKVNRSPRADVVPSVESFKKDSARSQDLELKSPKIQTDLASSSREGVKQLKK